MRLLVHFATLLLVATASGCSLLLAKRVPPGSLGSPANVARSLVAAGPIGGKASDWPCELTIMSSDAEGAFEGRISWPSLRSVNAVAGRVVAEENGYGVEFRETATIEPGAALTGTRYDLNLLATPGGHELRGQWRYRRRSGFTRLKTKRLPAASESLAALRSELREHVAAGDRTSSARLLDELGASQPLSAEEHWRRGCYYDEVSRRADADEAFEATLAAVPDLADASDGERLAVTRALLSLDRTDEALELSEAYGTPARAWALERALALAQLGDLAELGALPGDVKAHASGDPWSRVRCAQVLVALQAIPDAVDVLEGLLDEEPDFLLAWEELSSVHHRSGRYVDALACAERALELAPESAIAHNMRGAALGALGKDEDALAAYGCALEIEPRFVRALSNQARRWISLGQPRRGLKTARRAVSMDPRLAEAHDALGVALTRTGQLNDALAAFEGAIALAPRYERARLNRLGVLCLLERFAEALEAADRLLETAVDVDVLANTWLNRGMALGGLDDPEGQLACTLRGLELRPEDPSLRYTRARTLAILGRLDESLQVVEDLLEDDPDQRDARALRSMILERR